MATTSIHPIYVTEAQAITYIVNPSKTEQGLFVDNYACSNTPSTATKMFMQAREIGTGKHKTLAQHIHQNFMPGEVTPEQAFKIGKELAENLLKGDYQYILTTHLDKNHLHNHIIFNNVNMNLGLTFETLENRNGRAWETLRKESDKLCREYGLSVIDDPEKNKGKSWYEWSQDKQGMSWKTKLKFELDNCVMESANFDDFLEACRKRNIEAVYNPQHKINLKFRMEGQQKYTRARTLGWYYEVPQIRKRIDSFMLLKTGQLNYRPHTKIIDTSMQKNAALERWADIQNMKEASRVINILTEHKVDSIADIEKASINEHTYRMKLVNDLNNMQHEIDMLSDDIKAVNKYKKYRSFHVEYKAQKSEGARKKYVKEHAPDLNKFEEARAYLKERYPSGNVPDDATLRQQRQDLIEARNEKNTEYKSITAKLKELEYARQTVDEYLSEQDRNDQKKREELE